MPGWPGQNKGLGFRDSSDRCWVPGQAGLQRKLMRDSYLGAQGVPQALAAGQQAVFECLVMRISPVLVRRTLMCLLLRHIDPAVQRCGAPRLSE